MLSIIGTVERGCQRRLRNELLGVARSITGEAEQGIAARELAAFRRVLTRMTANLDRVER